MFNDIFQIFKSSKILSLMGIITIVLFTITMVFQFTNLLLLQIISLVSFMAIGLLTTVIFILKMTF